MRLEHTQSLLTADQADTCCLINTYLLSRFVVVNSNTLQTPAVKVLCAVRGSMYFQSNYNVSNLIYIYNIQTCEYYMSLKNNLL